MGIVTPDLDFEDRIVIVARPTGPSEVAFRVEAVRVYGTQGRVEQLPPKGVVTVLFRFLHDWFVGRGAS